jgi:predicted enzyme related to lactoylglutathione lyase
MAAKKKAKKKAMAAPSRAGKATAKRAAAKPAKRAAKSRKPAAAKGRARVHEIVHWEIQSQDPVKLHKFYAEAFGWKIDANNPMQYGMVSSAGKDGIDGGIGGTEGPGSRVVVYAEVPEIDAILERIVSLGGTTVMPRTDIGPVIMALYTDPEGNTMGLIEK